MSLRDYERKRDFGVTLEPRGGRVGEVAGRAFVIQKHAAKRIHFDLRLEFGGVLKSWAVPKGMPLVLGERKLAVQVEDHPMGYRSFEGTIPDGEYGAGTVMVWDRGEWESLGQQSVAEGFEAGKLLIALAGEKLRGEWHMVRLKDSATDWLVIKSGEDMAPIGRSSRDRSAMTGRTMAQIARGVEVGGVPLAKARRPHFVEPMKARLVKEPPTGDWSYEIKFDGYRALALVERGSCHLLSRDGEDFTARFPSVAAACGDLHVRMAVLDGEVVALDAEGRSSVRELQHADPAHEVFYYVFDLLQVDGQDLTGFSLEERRERLADILERAEEPVRASRGFGGDATMLMRQVRKLGLEGLIGKRLGSAYESGRRSGAWVKLKVMAQKPRIKSA